MHVTDAGAVEYPNPSRWLSGTRQTLFLTDVTPAGFRRGVSVTAKAVNQMRYTASRVAYVAVVGGTPCLRGLVAATLRADGLEATAGTTGPSPCRSTDCPTCATYPTALPARGSLLADPQRFVR